VSRNHKQSHNFDSKNRTLRVIQKWTANTIERCTEEGPSFEGLNQLALYDSVTWCLALAAAASNEDASPLKPVSRKLPISDSEYDPKSCLLSSTSTLSSASFKPSRGPGPFPVTNCRKSSCSKAKEAAREAAADWAAARAAFSAGLEHR